MDWLSGYTASYYMCVVDPITWRDVDRYEIISGTVSRDCDGLRENASLSLSNRPEDFENIIRIYLDAAQQGSAEHEPIFTGYLSTPQTMYDGTRRVYTAECYSVLKALEDIILPRGWYADKDRLVSNVIKSLTEPLQAPVDVIEEDVRLTDYIVAEDGTSRLKMLDRILETVGWTIRISGYGEVEIGPAPVEPAYTFDAVDTDCIESEIQIESDMYSAPNVMMIAADGVTGIAIDDDEESDISVPGRGREVWKCDSGASVPSNISIDQYAKQKLKEAQDLSSTYSYNRRYLPDIVPGDLVQMHYPAQEMSGIFVIQSQDISLSGGARTSEVIRGYGTTE